MVSTDVFLRGCFSLTESDSAPGCAHKGEVDWPKVGREDSDRRQVEQIGDSQGGWIFYWSLPHGGGGCL